MTFQEVHLTDQADPDAVATQLDATLRAGPVATATRRKGAFQTSTLSDLVDLISFAHWLEYASVGLVLALVATTTVMSVQDRVKEHAVLQTLGVRPGRVFRLVMAESLILCFAGGVLGTGPRWQCSVGGIGDRRGRGHNCLPAILSAREFVVICGSDRRSRGWRDPSNSRKVERRMSAGRLEVIGVTPTVRPPGRHPMPHSVGFGNSRLT